jgi:hypothetical protein
MYPEGANILSSLTYTSKYDQFLARRLVRFTSSTNWTEGHLTLKILGGLGDELKICFPSVNRSQIVFVAVNYGAHMDSFQTSFQDTSLNGCKCLALMKTDEFAISLLSVGSEQNPFIIKTEEA